jgi:hypothetical protein
MTTNFFTLLFCCCFWIRDPRSGIRDPGWVKIRIRDKHPGSATTKYKAAKVYGRLFHEDDLTFYFYLCISVFGNVVLFVYTDSCNISVENVSDLLNTGDMFLLPGRLNMKLDLL